MINNYEIKTINGNDILYLYFDYNSEFGLMGLNEKNNNLKDNINKYIKKNKIPFTGSIVAIIVGGVLVGNLLLKKDNSDSKVYSDNIIITNKGNLDSNNIYNVDEIGKDIDINDNASVEEIDNEVKVNEEVIKNVVTNDDNNSEVVEEYNENYEVDNNIYVNLKRNYGYVKLEIEEYVLGVVAAEMPAEFNIEALKAQSILARTYTLKALKRGITLTDNVSSQAYKSNDELRRMWGNNFDRYYSKVKEAVNDTKGIYLSYNGQYIDSVYHSTSNGKTEEATSVWGNYYPYLVSVDSVYDDINPSFIKTVYYSYDEISSKLGFNIDINTVFNILSKTKGDRVEKIEVNDRIYSGVELRNILGLRSADFEIEKNTDGVNIITKGYGHGVGMSQYGANGMAKNGYSYRDILLHYYPGVNIDYIKY